MIYQPPIRPGRTLSPGQRPLPATVHNASPVCRARLNGPGPAPLSPFVEAPRAALAARLDAAAAPGAIRVTGAGPNHPLTLLDALGRPVARAVADATGAALLAPRGLAAGVYVLCAPYGRTARLVIK